MGVLLVGRGYIYVVRSGLRKGVGGERRVGGRFLALLGWVGGVS